MFQSKLFCSVKKEKKRRKERKGEGRKEKETALFGEKFGGDLAHR